MNDEGPEVARAESQEERRGRLNAITRKVIACAHRVSNTLGVGFLEKVYENALAHELTKAGLVVQQRFALEVWYDGVLVGTYAADLLVEGCVLVELKAVSQLEKAHDAQCLNYLKATGLSVCLLLNFGCSRVKVRRHVNLF